MQSGKEAGGRGGSVKWCGSATGGQNVIEAGRQRGRTFGGRVPGCLKGLNGTTVKYQLFQTGRKRHYSTVVTDEHIRQMWAKTNIKSV